MVIAALSTNQAAIPEATLAVTNSALAAKATGSPTPELPIIGIRLRKPTDCAPNAAAASTIFAQSPGKMKAWSNPSGPDIDEVEVFVEVGRLTIGDAPVG